MAKKTKKELTILTLVVDRSGSMGTISGAMNTAIEDLLKKQAEEPGKLRINVITFDDTIEYRNLQVKAKEVEHPVIWPRGNTALNDAVAAGVTVTANSGGGDHYIMAIVTDGMENSSTDFPGREGTAKVKALLDEKRALGWTILFIGAESMGDVLHVASQYGNMRGQTIAYAASEAGAQNVGASVSDVISKSRSGVKTAAFTEEDRTAAAEK